MKQLSKEKHENVRKLFYKNYPNLPEIFAVIENLIPGQIWVDKEDEPRLCLIITNSPYCFVAGEVSEELFLECLEPLWMN